MSNSNSMNIVMVRSYYPNVRMEKQANVLARHGYHVTVLGWERYSRSDVEKPYRIKKLRLRVSPLSIRVAFYMPVWWLFIAWHLLTARWDVVHAIDLESFVPALIMAKIKRKPIIYDIADFFADTVPFPAFGGIARKITAAVDTALMKSADTIVIADDCVVGRVGFTADAKPLVVIRNSPNPEILDGVRSPTPRREPFNIYYGGGVYRTRGINDICLAISDLPDVQLTIAGPCPPRFQEELQETHKDQGNITLRPGWLPYEDIIAETVSADLLFVLADPAVPIHRYLSPNKLYEAMMCSKPIIVSDGSTMSDIVRTENCGLVVPYGDVGSIRKAILKLKSDPELCRALGRNGRRAYEEKYSWRIMEQRLLHAYRQLGNKASESHHSSNGHGR